VDIARKVAGDSDDIWIAVTTEDERIAEHCRKIGVSFIMTPESCRTGSDRVLSALRQMPEWPDFVINLQGDAPLTPPLALQSIIDAFTENPRLEVVTPVFLLSWEELDTLRESKKSTPFSGTTVVLNRQHQAIWFSKNIIPAIRKEQHRREQGETCPVWQHMGIYGFRTDILERFCELPPGNYEQLEGLEQLRMLENGIKIQAVPITIPGDMIRSGIDSPEDIARAEQIIAGSGGRLS
jgi:3-deoxy-manno-octulosonate cytidylyltransferase (CMP-KDO synthetase)